MPVDVAVDSPPAIPDVDPDADTLTVALALAKQGLYLGPIRPGDYKNPGSILGKGWPAKTTNDPKTLIAHFAARSLGLFLHVGRSGLVVADVDHPDQLPAVLRDAIEATNPPYQSTREHTPGRGHYLFACPPGRVIGNGAGQLGKAWGEIRGRNGVIVLFPSPHEKADQGARYLWERTGPIPVLPASVADLLPDSTTSSDAVTDAELAAFFKAHDAADRPELLDAVTRAFRDEITAGGSRHMAAVTATCWAMREAAAGLYPAQDAATDLRAVFVDAMRAPRNNGDRALDDRAAADEFQGIVAWAIGQTAAVDPDVTRAKVDERAPRNDRPQVVINGRPLPDVTDEIVGHLDAGNDPPALFIRSGEITSFRTDETGAPIVEILGAYKLRERISRVTDTLRVHKDGTTSNCPPPIDLVHNVLAQPEWPFPALQAVTELPTLRDNGTIHDQPGYDPHTRLLYLPGDLQVPPIPAEPTQADVKAAVEAIRGDLLGDFPFDSDADQANAIGLLLTPLVRPAIRGQVPLALIDATEPGTGKGLLANICAVLATGRPAAARPLSNNDEEARKMITAVLLSGPTIVVFDNIEAAISSPTLAGVLTTDEWADRMLGRSEDVRVPNRATWIATGNNLAVGGDIGRRCYRIKLNARCASPDQRTGFTHPDLIGWARDHRGDLVAALLTLARAWWATGSPAAPDTLTLGGFTPWVRTIAGILDHAGIEGFLGNLAEFRQTIDVEGQQWETFLGALNDLLGRHPTTAGAIANKLVEGGQELKDTIPSGLIDHIDKPVFARRLGDAFRQREGRRHGPAEWSVLKAGKNRLNAVLWTVESLATPITSDLANTRVATAESSVPDSAREPQVNGQARSDAESVSANARAESYPQVPAQIDFTGQLAEDDSASLRAPRLTSTSRAESASADSAPPIVTTEREISPGQAANPGTLGPYQPEF